MPDSTVYQDISDTFNKFVAKNDPFVATVLKGHLAVEELLDRIIKSFIARDVKIDEAILTFHQKKILARGFAKHNTQHKT